MSEINQTNPELAHVDMPVVSTEAEVKTPATHTSSGTSPQATPASAIASASGILTPSK